MKLLREGESCDTASDLHYKSVMDEFNKDEENLDPIEKIEKRKMLAMKVMLECIRPDEKISSMFGEVIKDLFSQIYSLAT